MKKRSGVIGFALVTCLVMGASMAIAVQPQKGAVDVIDTVPWKDIDILKAQPGLAVDVEDGEFMNLWINATKKPLDDPRVRQAIVYAIDRQAISEAAFIGYGTPLYGPPHH